MNINKLICIIVTVLVTFGFINVGVVVYGEDKKDESEEEVKHEKAREPASIPGDDSNEIKYKGFEPEYDPEDNTPGVQPIEEDPGSSDDTRLDHTKDN